MAPSSPEWQRLAKLKANDIDYDNEADEERNETLGLDFIKVSLSRRTERHSNPFFFSGQSDWIRQCRWSPACIAARSTIRQSTNVLRHEHRWRSSFCFFASSIEHRKKKSSRSCWIWPKKVSVHLMTNDVYLSLCLDERLKKTTFSGATGVSVFRPSSIDVSSSLVLGRYHLQRWNESSSRRTRRQSTSLRKRSRGRWTGAFETDQIGSHRSRIEKRCKTKREWAHLPTLFIVSRSNNSNEQSKIRHNASKTYRQAKVEVGMKMSANDHHASKPWRKNWTKSWMKTM